MAPQPYVPLVVRAAFACVMLPQLVVALTWGNFGLYRATQIMSVALLMLAVAVCRRARIATSLPALIIVSIVTVSFVTTCVRDTIESATFDTALAMKSVMIVAFILLIDRLREFGFQTFARSAMPITVMIVLATAVHFAVNPEVDLGRYTFFGLHPNLGGEILFGCMVLLTFSESAVLRVGLGALIIVLVTLLQSRATLGGAILLFFGGEAFRMLVLPGTTRRFHLMGIAFGLAGVLGSLVVLLLPDQLARLVDLVSTDLFLLHDQGRGMNTGLSGREETWPVALATLAEYPFFGAGMDRNIDPTAIVAQIHNGFFAAMAEFGLLSLGLLFVLAMQVISAYVRRSILFVVLLACLFVFFFNARSLNLNIFPMIMWLACLPWAERRS